MTPNGKKDPYKYKTVNDFVKDHPQLKGKSEIESEINWYNWEVKNILTSEPVKKPKRNAKK